MQLAKVYGETGIEEQRRYSPPVIIGVDYETIIGDPIQALACTSHIERRNLIASYGNQTYYPTHERILEKTGESPSSFGAVVCLYNLGRVHVTLNETPVMASSLEGHVLTIRELIEESAKF